MSSWPPPPPPPQQQWPYTPPQQQWPPAPVAPPRPWITGRLAAVAIAAGILVGVGVALPIALGNRGNQSSGSTAGGGGATPSATPVPNGPAAVQARQLYAQALAATRAAAGVHYVAVTTGAGDQKTTGDAGQSNGTQSITVTSSFGAEQFDLVLANDVVYFKGNAPAAEDQLGVAPADAPNVAGKWVSVARGDGPYTVLQPGITCADQAAEMPMVASSTEQVDDNGVKAVRIHGGVPAHQDVPAGTATMDVDASSHLPINYVSTVSAGNVSLTSTTTYSGWGKAPSTSAPAGSVAWSTLNTSEPPGGYGGGGGGGATPTPPGA